MNRAGGQPPRAMYSFPELKSAEILQCMADLNIPLADAELQKPTTQVVQKVYEAFAEIFMGTNKEEYIASENAPFMANVEYGEIYVDAVSLVRFFKVIVRLMHEIGIEDFGIRDLIKPEAPRFKIILSAIINFAKFREEQMAIYEELTRKADEIRCERDRCAQQHTDVSARLREWRRLRAEEEPQVQRVKEHNNALIQELRELKKEQTTLTNVIEELKARRQDYSEKLAHVQFMLNNSKQECNKLKSLIVHSPEKLVQILDELNGGINNERAALAQLEKKSRDMQARLEYVDGLEGDLRRCLMATHELDELFRNRSKLQAQIKDFQDQLAKNQTLLKDREMHVEQLNRQLVSVSDKLSRLHSQQQTKREQVEEKLKALRDDYAALSEERGKLAIKVDQSERVIKELEAKIGDATRVHEAEFFTLRTDCLNLKSQVLHYTAEIKKSF